jgi:hypothetical protein
MVASMKVSASPRHPVIELVDGARRMAVAAPVEGDGVRVDSLFGLCLRIWCGGAGGTLSA